ncbi:hypothetical protein, partial [Staphylococcus aureus]|uniref:hypothetical protein n=1 Tax=Staphylococcus aureus TaxID=1280 RepID=UPI001C8383D6
QDLILPEAIPLQIAQKLRARALHLKTSCVNQKKIIEVIYHRFFKENNKTLYYLKPFLCKSRKNYVPEPCI